MNMHRSGREVTLDTRQSRSQSVRTHPGACGFITKYAEKDHQTFTKCQWIDGQPSKDQYRKHGADAFKCLSTTQAGSSYCEKHHKKCFMPPKPLTKPE